MSRRTEPGLKGTKLKRKDIHFLTNLVSKELNQDPKLVKQVLNHAWKEVRENISNARVRGIYAKNLGTFRVKGSIKVLNDEIRKKIRKYIWLKKYPRTLGKQRPEVREEIYRMLQYRRYYINKYKQRQQYKDDYISAIRSSGTAEPEREVSPRVG